MLMSYAGIGSRKTPDDILKMMTQLGVLLANDGLTLVTGAALGADQSFAMGALSVGGRVKLHIPWKNYEYQWWKDLDAEVSILSPDDTDAYDSVKKHHPAYDRLSRGAIMLHARNYNIIRDSDFVVHWAPKGKPGGTGQGLKIAIMQGKTIYDLGTPDDYNKVLKLLTDRKAELLRLKN